MKRKKKNIAIKRIILIILVVLLVLVLSKILNNSINNNKTEKTNDGLVEANIDSKFTLTLNGNDKMVVALGGEYIEPGCTAITENGEDISSRINIEGEVDSSKLGNYIIKYNLKDSTITREVEVRNALSNNGLPVLMYHFFYDKSVSSQTNGNYMEISNFEEQMKYLSDNNYYFPSWNEVEQYATGKIDLPERSVVITVDDGDPSFFELAVPVINKYNVKATSFVITSWYDSNSLANYKSDKIDLQSHSETFHSAGSDGKGKIMTASVSETISDLKTSQEKLGGSTVFCYPFGHYNSTVEQTVKNAGFNLAFTVKGGRVTKNSDPLALPRVRMSIGTTIAQFKNMVK